VCRGDLFLLRQICYARKLIPNFAEPHLRQVPRTFSKRHANGRSSQKAITTRSSTASTVNAASATRALTSPHVAIAFRRPAAGIPRLYLDRPDFTMGRRKSGCKVIAVDRVRRRQYSCNETSNKLRPPSHDGRSRHSLTLISPGKCQHYPETHRPNSTKSMFTHTASSNQVQSDIRNNSALRLRPKEHTGFSNMSVNVALPGKIMTALPARSVEYTTVGNVDHA
jgi:hypothetical protein